ncbi:MAG: LysR family transcriptional regulator [Rhizobiaceae bacterium]|nr:LysR family transcriptional regulator [Rhizobiaceae bacterium]
MNLRHWEIVRAVIATGSVTRAAQMLGVSQPSVSQALRYAEDQLGFKLFRRLKGKLSPTLETSLLYPEIDRVFDRVAVVNELAHELRRSAFGQISVATIPTLSATLFPPAIAAWRAARPSARARIDVLSTTEVLRLVSNHLVDFGIIHTHASENDLQVEEILKTQMYCAMSPRSSLTRLDVVTPADLRGHPLIAARHSLDAAIEAAFRNAGETADIAIEVNHAFTACMLAREEVGVALIDPFALALAGEALVVRPFRPAVPLSTRILFSEKRPISALALEFIEILRSLVGEIASRGIQARPERAALMTSQSNIGVSGMSR